MNIRRIAITGAAALALAAGGAAAGEIPAATASAATSRTAIPRVKLSPRTGPPTSTVKVSGTGFGAHRAVDIYFDTTDKALASTNGHGVFTSIPVSVPASAVPGTHYITAVQRHSGRSAQARFLVNTNWAQFGFSPRRNTADLSMGRRFMSAGGARFGGGDDGDRAGWPLGRLPGCRASGPFEFPIRHLAFDDARVAARAAGEQVALDFSQCPGQRAGQS